MSNQTADQLVSFIDRQLTAGKKSLLVDFYGGEPLMSLGLIGRISTALLALARDRGIKFSSTLISNGSLFTRKTAKRLASLGLQSVKFTLDGPADIHDRYRPFKSGAGSFDQVFHNIMQTCDLVNVLLGGNYDQHSYPAFVRLLDHMMDKGLTPDRVANVKFDPILKPKRPSAGLAHYHGGCVTSQEPWIVAADKLLREAVLSRGYNTPKIGPIICAIEQQDTWVVNVNGDLYKCPAFLGEEDFVVGHVSTDSVADYSDAYRLDIWQNETCLACDYLPMCYGGCRYLPFAQTGAIDKVNCRKDFLDTELERIVRQDIRYLSPTSQFQSPERRLGETPRGTGSMK